MKANIFVKICCCICGKPANNARDFSSKGRMYFRFYCDNCLLTNSKAKKENIYRYERI